MKLDLHGVGGESGVFGDSFPVDHACAFAVLDAGEEQDDVVVLCNGSHCCQLCCVCKSLMGKCLLGGSDKERRVVIRDREKESERSGWIKEQSEGPVAERQAEAGGDDGVEKDGGDDDDSVDHRKRYLLALYACVAQSSGCRQDLWFKQNSCARGWSSGNVCVQGRLRADRLTIEIACM